MKSSISIAFRDAGEELVAASSSNIGNTLNQVLNRFLGWPFRAARGFACDSEGMKTDIFETLVYTSSQHDSSTEPLNVTANALACVVDVSERIDVEHLRSAYEKIARAKRLKKDAAPHIPGVPLTTVTLGIIFAQNTATPVEKLAEELDQLNKQHPDREWTDMVVVLSKATINYVAQFPGEGIAGDFLPPAEGALAAYIPPTYVIIFTRPTGVFTFNKMCAFLISHLEIFSPGANLPKWAEVLENTPKQGVTFRGYQYNLNGQLVPVPQQFYNDRYIPLRPLLIEDQKRNLLATLQFLPWQDGGVIMLRGKLPLDELLVLLGNTGLDRKGIIARPDFQISYVLPIKQADFEEMVQKIPTRFPNMVVKTDSTKWIIEKLADEGSSSPFVARLFMGILRLRDAVLQDDSRRRQFDQAYKFVIMTLINTRTTSQQILEILAEHSRKVSQGKIARVSGQAIHIDESIDKELRKETESFLNSAVRALKEGMQGVTKALQIEIGFLFQKPNNFEREVNALEKSNPPLAAYLQETRKWSERLVACRIAIEHERWMLPKITYSEASGVVYAEEPQISDQPISEFVRFMMDRISCFTEEITVHCLQARMPRGVSIIEIPLSQRELEKPERFQLALTNGGTSIWKIAYHQAAFEES